MNVLLRVVRTMHQNFELDEVEFSHDEFRFRVSAMIEELSEFVAANNKEDQLDALVDLAVFLFGTVDRMGFNDVFDEAFSRVMASNMEKTLGPNQKRGSFQLDLVKPQGWEPANLKDLVEDV